MTILLDARPLVDPAGSGVARVARALIAAYAVAYPQDTLLCVTTGWKKPHLPDTLNNLPNVIHQHIRLPNKVWSALSYASLTSLVSAGAQASHIDVIFFPNIGFMGRVGTSRPSVLLLHDLSFLIEPQWFAWKRRLWHRAVRAQHLITNATALLAVSQQTKRDATRLLGIPPERIYVIPIGQTLDTKPAKCQTPNARRQQYVLALGSGDPRKNIGTAIEAVRGLRKEKQYKDVELILVGLSPKDDAHVREPWIHAIRHPSDDVLSSLYRNAAVLLYPSWYEGFGLPLHEAAAHGTPCISSTAGALTETAPPGTLFANPAKPQQWIEALKLALAYQKQVRTATPSWDEAAAILREVFLRPYPSLDWRLTAA